VAVMRMLDPAPEEALPTEGWRLIALDAGRYAAGLQATIQTWNSTMQHTDLLHLADPTSWADYTGVAAVIAGCTPAQVHEALLRLTVAVEGQLRAQAQHVEERAEHLSQATQLLALAADAELWHTPEGEAYATIEVDGHRETWRIKEKGFRRWLSRLFYQEHEKTPGSQAIQDAIGVLEGKAIFDGKQHEVHVRTASDNSAIYLDLADKQWHAIKITAQGWSVISDPPVKFRRAKGMLPLPMPTQGGTLDALRNLLNVADDDTWTLTKAYLQGALNPDGPSVVLGVHGEQGSTKSTHCRMIRALIEGSAPVDTTRGTRPRHQREQQLDGRDRQPVNCLIDALGCALPSGHRRRVWREGIVYGRRRKAL
jgi:hypothetical protein